MRTLITIILLFLGTINVEVLYSQENNSKEITVIGYAHREITPDEIFYSIEIEEYFENRQKVTLSEIENKFWKVIEQMGIEKSMVKIDNISERNITYRRKKEETTSSKTFQIKFKEIEDLDNFARQISKIPIQRAKISKVGLSDFLKIEEELLVEAVKNAKKRAKLIVDELGAELGLAIQVTENIDNDLQRYLITQYYDYNSRIMRMESGFLRSGNEEKIEFKKLNLGVTVRVTFEIKN
ncbi:MAG: SIMPL domain-containing protein [Bacteroidetes bacterium]|nr:MAG: SIMPL domain-containing protein [Bacteroidota bacterium]